jgi:hypothetical protein
LRLPIRRGFAIEGDRFIATREMSMRLPLDFAAVALAAMALAPAAADAATPSLCGASEKIIFACSTGAHIVSICESADGKSLQYRFGVRNHLDIAYPAAGTPAASVFTSGTMMFSGGGGAWLSFKRGPFAYTAFTGIGKWGKGEAIAEAAGVAVSKDDAEFANFPCRDKEVSELGPDLFAKLGLADKSQAEPFDIPGAFMP